MNLINIPKIHGPVEENKAPHNLRLLCNVHTLLALPYLMPLLESVNQLIEYS
jgi:hypothetical protein